MWNQGVSRYCSEGCERESLSHSCLLASGGCQKFLVFLDVEMHHFCLCLHIAFFVSLCLKSPSAFLLQGHLVLDLGPTLKSRRFPGGSDGKVSACNVGDPGSIPESGKSRGEGNGNPLQYSCLEK